MKIVSIGQLMAVTRQALLTSGEVLKKGIDQRWQVTYKTPISPVTQIDLESEKKIVSLIRRRFKGHAFLSEESKYIKKKELQPSGPNRYRWVIDPLDGTTNYVHRCPHACVSIAVERNGVVQAGGIIDPFRKELFIAGLGKGSRCNGKKIFVSKQRIMKHSLLITGFPYDRDKKAVQYLKVLKPFLERSMGVRRMGAAALDLAWVACGRADGYWEYKLQPWDVAAGFLLVSEAGGIVTDFSNKKAHFETPDQTLASNGHIHTRLIQVFENYS